MNIGIRTKWAVAQGDMTTAERRWAICCALEWKAELEEPDAIQPHEIPRSASTSGWMSNAREAREVGINFRNGGNHEC